MGSSPTIFKMKKIQRKVFKDLQKRIDFQQSEIMRREYLSIRKSESLRGTPTWWDSVEKINNLGAKGSISRIRNICKHTGRSRGVLVKFGLSRMEWRRMADRGEIPGVRRASW